MRYHTTGRDNWSHPSQRRPADFGRGPIQSLIDDRPEGEPHPVVGMMVLTGIAAIGAAVWMMLP